MHKLYIDFETRCSVDLREHGLYNYMESDDFMLLCLGYTTSETDAPHIFTPEERELHIAYDLSCYTVYGHGMFDFYAWNKLMHEQFEWPSLKLEQYVDTISLAKTYTLPDKLKDIAQVLQLSEQKSAGAHLINKFSKPQKTGRFIEPHHDPHAFKEFCEYCKQDVATLRAIVQTLPRDNYIQQERKVWAITQDMNLRGMPVDIENAKAIYAACEEYKKNIVKTLPGLTKGKVTTAGQVAKTLEFCKLHGVTLPDLQAETVEEALDKELPTEVKQVLQIRKICGRTSTKKYERIIKQYCSDGTVKGLLQYHGAAPGRWAGRSVQLHNLPRAKVKDPELAIQQILTNQIPEGTDPIKLAKALIRPMFLAPDGKTFAVLDYSSIENVLLLYCAGDPMLEVFRQGRDPYKDMAAYYFGIPYDKVDDIQRQFGKVLILGCGYGMQGKKLCLSAKGYGLDISEEQGNAGVAAWRAKHSVTVQWWYSLYNAAKRAIVSGQLQQCTCFEFKTFKKNGIKWLGMKLPSGKAIYYMTPSLEMGEYNQVQIVHQGINPYSKKWGKLRVTPGRLVENSIQALARECLAHGKINIQERLPEVELVMSVHDETISLVPEEKAELYYDEIIKCMLDLPWLPDVPLKAKGFIAKRYRKD